MPEKSGRDEMQEFPKRFPDERRKFFRHTTEWQGDRGFLFLYSESMVL